MIVTVTPNPSLDLLFSADRLVYDDANRVPMPRRRPGGQGINVVRAARALGTEAAHAIAPLGGPVGDEIRQILAAEGTPLTAVSIRGETRVFVGVRESEGGRSLLLNPRGPEIAGHEIGALERAVDRVLSAAVGDGGSTTGSAAGSAGRASAARPWLVTCGSTLPGMPATFYRDLGRRARERGARFVPDCDGDAVAAAVADADLLVPNGLEAGRLVARSVTDAESAVAAARTLRERGPERVAVTLGADGAVLVTDGGAWWARPYVPQERAEAVGRSSAVGAGDAFLAALLMAFDEGVSDPDALARGVAAGTAVLLSEGAALVSQEDAETVAGWIEVDAA